MFSGKKPATDINRIVQTEQDAIDMTNSELETSGLREKKTVTNMPVLPDGSQPVQLGSGVITGVLGEGGSAVIYEIKNNQLGLQRAVKLLKPQYTRDTYNRFLREFRISIQLSHPNLAVVHTIGQWNKLPFIEMEKVTGFTLSEIVSQFGPLPTGLVTAIGIILCKSLEYLHTCTYEIDKKRHKGLLHLDLKPSNVLLSDSGVLKIMDFGLSTPSEDVQDGDYPKAGIGSPQYIAPELLLGEALPDVRSDIYSLGCILYELLSGVKTFPGPEEDAVLQLRQTNTFVSLKKLTRTIPAELLKLIEECLSLRKDGRPLNIETIRRDLETIHQSVTRLTPENTIQLYVTQRRANAPFTLPRPVHSLQAGLRVAGILLLISGVVLVSGYYALTTYKGDKAAAVTVKAEPETVEASEPSTPTPTPPKQVGHTRNNSDAGNEETEFYAPAIDNTQSALMDSVRLAWSSRKFDVMIALIERLPPELAQSKEVRLYQLRALGRGGEELGKLLDQTEVPDGEYYFHKARYLFGNKKYKETLANLDKAVSLPCEFLDKRILGREVQLYKSRSLTAIFRANPTSENLKAALDSWNLLLKLVADKPNGIHGKEAQKEKQNLVAEAEWRGIS